MKATNISCYGDQRYKDLLSAVARKKGIKVAKLVRDAIDTVYAVELAEADIFLSGGVQGSTQPRKDD